MRVCNIYPIANQHHYKKEKMVMILAHLVKKGLYKPEYFQNKQYIIMDNGLYEKAQVSTSLQDCIDIAEASGIPVNEIIIPDSLNDYYGNIKMFEDNLETIVKYKDKYTFMFVAQAKTYEEMLLSIEYANRFYGKLNLTIGISKLCALARDSLQAISIYRKSKFPIHFLGIKTTFKELLQARTIIRSCDTSQLAYMAKNELIVDDIDIVHYERSEEIGPDIDLEFDKLSNHKLNKLISSEKEQFKDYGIL